MGYSKMDNFYFSKDVQDKYNRIADKILDMVQLKTCNIGEHPTYSEYGMSGILEFKKKMIELWEVMDINGIFNLNPQDFVVNTLLDWSKQIEGVEFRYKYDKFDQSHMIEIKGIDFNNDPSCIALEREFSDKFNELFKGDYCLIFSDDTMIDFEEFNGIEISIERVEQ